MWPSGSCFAVVPSGRRKCGTHSRAQGALRACPSASSPGMLQALHSSRKETGGG